MDKNALVALEGVRRLRQTPHETQAIRHQTKPTTVDTLLNLSEAVRRYQTYDRVIYGLVEEGALRAVRRHRRIFYLESELDRVFRARISNRGYLVAA